MTLNDTLIALALFAADIHQIIIRIVVKALGSNIAGIRHIIIEIIVVINANP